MIKVIGYLCFVIMIYKGFNYNVFLSVLVKIIVVELIGDSIVYSEVIKLMN